MNSLKNETNTIHVSLIVPQNDHLNNKVNEVNSRLINMCQQRNIKIINYSDTIGPSKHLNESLFHLNRYGAIEFANNFLKTLCNLDYLILLIVGGLIIMKQMFQILFGIRFIMVIMKF